MKKIAHSLMKNVNTYIKLHTALEGS